MGRVPVDEDGRRPLPGQPLEEGGDTADDDGPCLDRRALDWADNILGTLPPPSNKAISIPDARSRRVAARGRETGLREAQKRIPKRKDLESGATKGEMEIRRQRTGSAISQIGASQG